MRRCALVILGCLGGVLAQAGAAEPLLRVTARLANVRSEPSLQSRVLLQLKSGDTLPALEQRGEWWRVRLPAGGEGFLHGSVVEATAPTPADDPESPEPTPQAAPSPAGAGLSVAHQPIDCIVAGRFIRVEARFEPSERVARARTYFRAAGTPAWYYVEMQAESGAFVSVLPQAKLETERVEYYLQALDTSFSESRTPEHAPRVVGGRGECSDELVVAMLPAAKLLVSGPAGAPLVPAGFGPAGIAGAGAGGTAASSAVSKSGMSGKTLAVIGGGAAAIGVVALAAGGGSSPGPSAPPPQPSFGNARFSPASVTCSSTTARGGFFVANLLVDGTNPTASLLSITSASDVLTFVAVTPDAGNAVGQSISQMGLRYTPDTVGAGASATIQFQLPLGFQNASRCRSFSGTSQLAAELTIVSSAGSFTVRPAAPLNLVYP